MDARNEKLITKLQNNYKPRIMSNTPIKAYTKKELADLYTISVVTLSNWIKDTGVFTDTEYQEYKKQKIVKPTQVKQIFLSKIGAPEIELFAPEIK